MPRNTERARAIVAEFVERPYENGFSRELVANPTNGRDGCLIDSLGIPIPAGQRCEAIDAAVQSLREIYPFGKRDWESLVWRNEIDKIIQIVDESLFKFIFKFKGPKRPDTAPELPRLAEGPHGNADHAIPAFRMYDPHFAAMSHEQKTYFADLGGQIDDGVYPDVAGNISYLFLYSYVLIERWEEVGFEELYRMLNTLSRAYRSEVKFADLCGQWASHCLLGSGLYDDFLAATEPGDPFAGEHILHSLSAMRCNVLHHLRRPANPVDLLKMSKIRLNEYTYGYPSEFREQLTSAFADEERRSGPWFARLLAKRPPRTAKKPPDTPEFRAMLRAMKPGPRGIQLFGILFGSDRTRRIKLPVVPIYAHGFRGNIGVITGAVREAENRLRDANGVPRIGEGWVSETELYNLIRDSFPGVTVEHHGRPVWLGRQHLDIWIPEWKIAVEYHGAQHFRPVDFFGGEAAFLANQERDRRKEQLCLDNKVKLFVVSETGRSEEIVTRIKEASAGASDR